MANNLQKTPKIGGITQTLEVEPSNILSLAVDSTNVYWADGTPAASGMMTWGTGSVSTVGINGGSVTNLASWLTYPMDVAVDSANVYWTDIAVREMAK